MSEFKKYMHIERFGTDEVQGIELGDCYVFPKLDGTNASLWSEDGKIQAGSRKRHLSIDADNAGFFEWAKEQEQTEEDENHPGDHSDAGDAEPPLASDGMRVKKPPRNHVVQPRHRPTD